MAVALCVGIVVYFSRSVLAADYSCSQIKTLYKDSTCCGQPSKMLSSLGEGVSCGSLKAMYRQQQCCSKLSSPAAPTSADMVSAKLLYVKMKMNYSSNPQITSIGDLRTYLGDGNGTEPWAAVPGLRHKYFTYSSNTQTTCGVYVFFSQAQLDSYMDSGLFKSAPTWPHVAELTYEVKDVMRGTEKCIEKTKWAHTPPTREDLTAGKMLIVDLTVNYTTGMEGFPTKKEDLYYAMDEGGYTGQFATLEGLRGKYFAYDDTSDHVYGFYTFINEKFLNQYMASELFTSQGSFPHIAAVTYEVQDILEGTERTMDLPSWGLLD